jgi:uncharacterized oligopeptide transporter (OPT) family protein
MTRIQNELNNEEELDDESSGTHSRATKEVEKLRVEVISSLRASVKATQNTFRVNFYMNVVIFILGTFLIGTAVGESILKGIDPFSVTFGGLGVASFVAVFLLNPQSRLQENLCKLSQMNFILSNFLYEYDRFLDFIKEISSVKELVEVNKEGERIISFTLQSINEFVAPQEKQADGKEAE